MAEPDLPSLKRAAALRALELVESGMLLGIGTGSTARFFIEGLRGMRVTAVATSRESAGLAREAGVDVIDDVRTQLDLAVDGADEIDPELRLIKGHGGALFREKLVAMAARRFVVIADSSKLVPRLGRTYLPVEVTPFLWRLTAERLAPLATAWKVRGGEGTPYRTDSGNVIVDLTFAAGIERPEALAAELKGLTGVIEHGLFLGLADRALVATPDGVRELTAGG